MTTTNQAKDKQPSEEADFSPSTGSASEPRHPDCAAIGGPTISRVTGCINDEMRECIVCRQAVVHDLTEHSFFGFEANCPQKPNTEASDAGHAGQDRPETPARHSLS